MELNQTQMLDRLSKEISDIAVDATQAQAALTREGSAIKAEDLKAIGDALTSLVNEGRYLTKSQKVLSSLYFKSMKTRHSNVAPAHAQTFDWVFRPTSEKSRHSRPPVHFLDWLTHRNGIFWVSGKPCSRKLSSWTWCAISLDRAQIPTRCMGTAQYEVVSCIRFR